jgi:N-acetylmuramic acid 6-phosphate etherase
VWHGTENGFEYAEHGDNGYATAVGAATIGVSCNPDAPLRELCQVFIGVVVGPEIIAGSTRLKCGTAQKMVLNMLSTATMVRLGRVEGNLMIDLRPASAKLWARAVSIVQELTGASFEQAESALKAAEGNVREAVASLSRPRDE